MSKFSPGLADHIRHTTLSPLHSSELAEQRPCRVCLIIAGFLLGFVSAMLFFGVSG